MATKETAMRTTKIEIEGPEGRATVGREGKLIHIHVYRDPRAADAWVCHARDPEDQEDAARRLHRALEGYDGTRGDLMEYLRVIRTFAD